MRTTKLIIALALILSASAVAIAATPVSTKVYRACCVDEPNRHGCRISDWYITEDEANQAGARHAERTSGHTWRLESMTRP